MSKQPIRVVFLTNAPAPYRERLHELIAMAPELQYSVIYCSRNEPLRNWSFQYGSYSRFFLKADASSFRHNDVQVWRLLQQLDPCVLILTGLYPTNLYAFVWCLLKQRRIIYCTDGTYHSESALSGMHKMVRRLVFARAKAFLSPGKGTNQLLHAYGVRAERIFRNCLSVDNERFCGKPFHKRTYHLMFSGRITHSKQPLFFAAVARLLRQQLPELKVLILGEGQLKDQLLRQLEEDGVAYLYAGSVTQQAMPGYFAAAKLLLFPTLQDAWGIVANEACASGTPVITCAASGVAHDLVVHETNGYVLPLDAPLWAAHAYKVLTDYLLWNRLSKAAESHVARFSHEQAARGVLSAIECSLTK